LASDHRAHLPRASRQGESARPGTRAFGEAAGVKNVYFESPETAHEWLTWRRALNDFAPRLFR
jgi:enterochelin esterase family protein